ncbi:MAG: tyrosine-type recombinase/integrase, partial [Gammaproteobacteria bacterium]
GNLKHLLPARSKLTRGHHAALPYTKIADFVARLRVLDTVAAKALEFTILTASRTDTTIKARWVEFDLDAKVWTIPGMDLKTGRRMKAGKQHRVPLCDRCLAILAEMNGLGEPEHVFPGQRPGKHLSTGGMSSAMKRLKETDTVHGFRSTFKDWARECTGFPNEISEAALAHIVGDKVERAYARGDALERRRELMLAWSAFCDPERAGNIVPIRKGA